MGNQLGIRSPNVPEFPEEENNRGGLAKILTDPRLTQFLLSMGLNLSQPRRIGQSELGGFSESLLAGFKGLEFMRESQVARERLEREENLKAIEAANKAVGQTSDLKTARVERRATRTRIEATQAETAQQGLETERFARAQPGVEEAQDLSLARARLENRGLQQGIDQGPDRLDLLRQQIFLKEQEIANAQRGGDTEDARINVQRQQLALAKLNTQFAREKLAAARVETSDPSVKRANERFETVFKAMSQRTAGLPLGLSEELRAEEIAAVNSETRNALDAADSSALEELIVSGSTNIQALRERAGGFAATEQVDNGKPVFVANKPFRGPPINNGPYSFGTYTDRKGNEQDAIRLETEDAVYFFILAEQGTNG